MGTITMDAILKLKVSLLTRLIYRFNICFEILIYGNLMPAD